jgi:hypothetical protein
VFYINGTGDSTFVDVYRLTSSTDPFYMFNMTSTVFPEDLGWTINTVFSNTYMARKFAAIMNGTNGTLDLSVFGTLFPETNIPAAVAWLAIFGACCLVGLLATIFVNIPRYKKLRLHEKILPVFSFATPLFIGFTSILFVPFAMFLPFAAIMVGLAVFMVDIVFIVKPIVQAIKTRTGLIGR